MDTLELLWDEVFQYSSHPLVVALAPVVLAFALRRIFPIRSKMSNE